MVLQIPSERVISNLAEYGNTSAASIPLALDEAVRAGSVKPDDTVGVMTTCYALSTRAAMPCLPELHAVACLFHTLSQRIGLASSVRQLRLQAPSTRRTVNHV